MDQGVFTRREAAEDAYKSSRMGADSMKTPQAEAQGKLSFKGRISIYFVSSLIALAISLVLLTLLAVVMVQRSIPDSLTSILTYVAAGAGSLAGGFLCSRGIGSKGLINGLMAGAFMFVLLYLLGFIVSGRTSGAGALPILLATILLGAVGGIVGINAKK